MLELVRLSLAKPDLAALRSKAQVRTWVLGLRSYDLDVDFTY